MAKAPTFSTIALEIHEQVALVILDRPNVHNALSDALIEELTRALKLVERDRSVRAVILMGAGENFCAGADLDSMKKAATQKKAANVKDATALGQLLFTLSTLSKATIARVQGLALGSGVGLVACCDIAIAAQDAMFGFSEVRLGLIPATISPYVLSAIGPRHARRYFVTGERFTAAEAFRLGLVHDIVVPAELDSRVNEVLADLLRSSPAAIAQCKDLIRAVSSRAVTPAVIADTAQRLATIRSSPEGMEGMAAFLEKRSPSWAVAAPTLSTQESETEQS